VEFLNTLSNKYVNPESLVTFYANDLDEQPLIAEKVVDTKPEMFEPVLESHQLPKPLATGATIKVNSLNFGVFEVPFRSKFEVDEVVG
jgi:hypothetical protein